MFRRCKSARVDSLSGDNVQVDDASVQAVNGRVLAPGYVVTSHARDVGATGTALATVGADANAGAVGITSADATVQGSRSQGERESQNDAVPVVHHGHGMVPGQDENDTTQGVHGGEYMVTECSRRDPPPNVLPLPTFSPASRPHFSWGPLEGSDFVHVVDCAYAEAVHWRRNVFLVPSGKSGNEFVRETTRLLRAFTNASAMEVVALKAVMLMPSLLLQRPAPNSKSAENAKCLERRLAAWKNGELDSLVREARTIQQYLLHRSPNYHTNSTAHAFAKLMTNGKVNGALRLLSDEHGGGPLPLDDLVDGQTTVLEVLISKHPPAQQLRAEAILPESEQRPPVHSVLFERITGPTIRAAALLTKGSAGPSCIDAAGWRRLCTSFHGASKDLCAAVALVARRLCTEHVDPTSVTAFKACRLIPLNKRPGVRPIGVCETLRRIIGKAVMTVVKTDVQKATGAVQLCGGQQAGIEAAIHAMRSVYEAADTEAILLVDAKNAFNTMNRQTALRNIAILCPSISTILDNTYRTPSELFVGGQTILSKEGTTQGDPLAMAMYAVASVPLTRKIDTLGTTQAWFADDATAGGRISALRTWWDRLGAEGPDYGYDVNPPKSWLICKPDSLEEATRAFDGTGVKITPDGARHLGAALGTPSFTERFVEQKVAVWANEMKSLTSIARSEPHAAYCAFTRGLIGRWVFISRAIPDIHNLLGPLEMIIREEFLPALLGRPAPGDQERNLLALPARHGGMALVDPSSFADQHGVSVKITEPLVQLILHQGGELGPVHTKQQEIKRQLSSENHKKMTEQAATLRAGLSTMMKRAVELAVEKGASTWLTTQPIAHQGFHFSKSDFRDAACLRYGWAPERMPAHCVCRSEFSVNHALSCPRGGFPSIRHNELRDMFGHLLTEVCHNVSTEPHLQPLDSELPPTSATTMASTADGARSDIAASGFWGGRFERTFFDVRIFDPNARSYLSSSIPSLYRRFERAKRNVYEQRIREVEHATFAPLVWSTSGGASKGTTAFMKRLASLLADKREETYSETLHWLRCRVSYALTRSSIMCIRGSRSAVGRPANWRDLENISVALAEGQCRRE